MLVVDLQATQSLDHRDRGVAGYVRQLALAIERLDPGRVAGYALNRDLPLPGGVEPLIASGKLRFRDEIDWTAVEALHVASPYELSVPVTDLVAPRWSGRLIVTLFDLVSEVLADVYLEDPGLRRRYRARHEIVRHADEVIAISQCAKTDAERLLGVDPSKVRVVTLAPAPMFVPDERAQRDRFVLYTGGTDHRKNVERLLQAWGRLPDRVRTRYKLVFAFNVKPLERNHFEVMADQLGFRDGLDVRGWVPDEEMVRLTQRAALVVYPSLYEGFGLPIAEALACATPVLASNTSSHPELLPADAMFDPYDVDDMARSIANALDDSTYRRRLLDYAASAPRRTYDDVAQETLAIYDTVAARSPRRVTKPGRTRLAFVTPLPPVPGGVSDYSFQLLLELVEQRGDVLDVDAYVDGPPHERDRIREAVAPKGVTARPLAALERVEAIEGAYDHIVVSLGNSEYHTGGLALLRRRAGIVVLAHDVRLTNLYRFAQWQHADAVGGEFGDALHRMYSGLPATLGAGGSIAAGDAERWGVLMAREAIAASARYLVTSRFALEMAHLDAPHGERDKLAVLPFSVGAVPLRNPTPADARIGPPVVASFGVVNDLKQGQTLVEAFHRVRRDHPGAQLVFVGPVGDAEAARLHAPGVELTGTLPDESYTAWLDRAWVAVQLRSATNGESSGAVGDCLTAGVPTIVTAIGPARDLPDDAAIKVPTDLTVDALAAHISAVIDSASRRRELFDGARRYADEHSFARAAAALYDAVVADAVE